MSATPKLLLIEDNPRIAGQLRALLEAMGLEVHIASTGVEGLLTYNRELPHVVVMEQFLPILSGEDVLRRLRSQMPPALLPTVMLVSSRFGSLTRQTREQLDVVLEKPLQAQRFQQGAQHALQKSQGQPKPIPGAHKPEQFYLRWGDLQTTPLPMLLFQCSEEKFTGILTLALPQGERRLAFRDGALYYAESLAPEEQFLSFLQRRAADSQPLSRLDQVVAGTGGRAVLQREALLRSGHLPALELGPLYRLYLENVVIRSLFLTQGPFQMLDDLAYVERVTTDEPLTLLPMLFEGVQHYYTPPKLLHALSAYRESACLLAPQYAHHVPALMQKFPSVSFSPQRIIGKTLGAVLDEFSPNMALNAQIVQTLLLAQLLSFQTEEESGQARQPVPPQPSKIRAPTPAGQSAAQEPENFPSGAYRSSLPPLPGMPPAAQPPAAQQRPATPAYQTGQHPPHMRTGQHPHMRTGQHPHMRTGQHGQPLHRTGQHPPPTQPLHRTGQHPHMRTGQHGQPLHRTGQHGKPLPGPLHRSGQHGQPLHRTGQHPHMRTGQHGQPLHRTGQQPAQGKPLRRSGPLPVQGRPDQPRGGPAQGKPLRRSGPLPVQGRPQPQAAKSSAHIDALPPRPEPNNKGNHPSSDPTFRRQLDDDYLRVQSDDYFTVLNLSVEATDDEIRSAYKRFFRLYNADRFKREPNKEIAVKANEVYRRSSQACAVLSTPHARKAYEEQREKRKPANQNSLLFAQEEFRQGEYYLQNKRFREAIPHFRRALEANEKDPAYYLRLGWSLYRSAPTDQTQALLARTYIEKALQMNPIFEDAYFYLGFIRKEQGARDEATALFQRILLLNPGHADAHKLLAELSGH